MLAELLCWRDLLASMHDTMMRITAITDNTMRTTTAVVAGTVFTIHATKLLLTTVAAALACALFCGSALTTQHGSTTRRAMHRGPAAAGFWHVLCALRYITWNNTFRTLVNRDTAGGSARTL